MKIILSIITGLLIILPTIISILIYKKKKLLNWIYGGLILTLITTILSFNILLEIRLPDNRFDENSFKRTYKDIFNMELPIESKITDKKYEKEIGLFGNETWKAKISLDERAYFKLLNNIKTENKILLKDYNKNEVIDCETGIKIAYSINTNYMNPWNYKIDFFEDNKTIRVTITVLGD